MENQNAAQPGPSAALTGSGHTAGPWVWVGPQLLAERYMASEPVMIAEDDPYGPSDEDKPLIAAAPDLLSVAEEMESNWPVWLGTPRDKEFLTRLRAAIAKARGQNTNYPSKGSV